VWLMALAAGEASYERTYDFLSHGLAQVVIAGWLLAFAYHLCNGVRHLTWDAGIGLEKHEARRSAAVTVVATVLIFAALIYIAFYLRAGGAA
jgi:succinate dehydrogenase / fumarate reductase, cytochrome b subunit